MSGINHTIDCPTGLMAFGGFLASIIGYGKNDYLCLPVFLWRTGKNSYKVIQPCEICCNSSQFINTCNKIK
jgi:hypothetical protein